MAAAFNGNHIRILSLLKYLNVGFLFLKDQGHEVDCEPMKDLSYCSYRVTHMILAVMPTADRPYRTAVMMTGTGSGCLLYFLGFLSPLCPMGRSGGTRLRVHENTHVTKLSSKPAQAPPSWALPSFTVRDPSERLSLYLPWEAALRTDVWSPSKEQLWPKTMRMVTVMTWWWLLKFPWLLLSRHSSKFSLCVISFLHRTAAIVDPVTYMFETQGS